MALRDNLEIERDKTHLERDKQTSVRDRPPGVRDKPPQQKKRGGICLSSPLTTWLIFTREIPSPLGSLIVYKT